MKRLLAAVAVATVGLGVTPSTAAVSPHGDEHPPRLHRAGVSHDLAANGGSGLIYWGLLEAPPGSSQRPYAYVRMCTSEGVCDHGYSNSPNAVSWTSDPLFNGGTVSVEVPSVSEGTITASLTYTGTGPYRPSWLISNHHPFVRASLERSTTTATASYSSPNVASFTTTSGEGNLDASVWP